MDAMQMEILTFTDQDGVVHTEARVVLDVAVVLLVKLCTVTKMHQQLWVAVLLASKVVVSFVLM